MNPTKHDDNSETPYLPGKVKAKSCMGIVFFTSFQLYNGWNPICLGIPLSSHEVSPSTFEEEEPKFKLLGITYKEEDQSGKDQYGWFLYDCIGYSTYLDQSGKESSSDKQTTRKKPVCTGLGRYIAISGALRYADLQAELRAQALNKEHAFNKEGASEF